MISTSTKRKYSHPLLRVIVGVAIALGLLHIGLAFFPESRPVLVDVPLLVPMIHGFVALTTLLVAFLALGRHRVLRDPVSYWVGIAFAAFCVASAFYVLTWPGLRTGGQPLVGNLPDTSSWIYTSSQLLFGVLLALAVSVRWPGEQALKGRRWFWSVAGCLILVTFASVLLIAFEENLPAMLGAEGSHTLLRRTLAGVCAAVYAVGAVLSMRRYLRSRETLPGYVALALVLLTYASIETIAALKRYTPLWYSCRLLAIAGFLVVLLGLLWEYIRLYRRERDKSVELETHMAALKLAEAAQRQLAQFPAQNPNPVMRVGADNALLYANLSARTWLTNGWNWRPDVALPDPVTTLAADAFRKGQPVEKEIASSDGRTFWCTAARPLQEEYVNIYGEDITDHKQYEEERERLLAQTQDQRALLDTVIEHLPVGIEIAEAPSGRLMRVNEQTRRIWRMDKLEANDAGAYGKFVAFHPDGRQYSSEDWQIVRALRGEVILGEEVSFLRGDGSRGVMRASAAPVRDAEGNIVAAIVAIDDVTRDKRIADALRRSEERYRALFNSMAEGFALHEIITDESGKPVDYRFLDVNPAFERLTGLKRADVLGKRVLEVMPEIEGRWSDKYGKVAADGEPVHFEDYSSTLGRWYEVFCYRPAPGQFAVILADVTVRRQAEDALRQSREDLNRAQAVGQIGSWRLDVGRNVLTWSDENHRMFGIPKGTPMTYETFLGTVHPDDRLYVDFKWNAGLRGEPYDIEHRIVVDGEVRYVREKAYLEFDAAGKLFGGFGITQDITERKKTEIQLQELTVSLERRVARRTGELNSAVEALSAEQRRFHEVLDALPVYVVLLSPDYRVPFANRFFEERFGKSGGRRCYEYMFGRTKPCENCETFKVLKTHAPHHWEWTGPDNRNYDIHDFPFTDVDGSRLILEVGLDITERKKAEEAVHTERRRLYDVMETLPVMVRLLTTDYHVAFANRSFREKFGNDNGRHCYEYVHGRSGPCEFCESYSVLSTGKSHHWEWTSPDGSIIDAYGFPFTDADGSPLILEMDIDITERRHDERALADRSAEIQRLADQLRALALDLSQAEQMERKRLARILHDHIQQLLVSARMQVEWMTRDNDIRRLQATAQGVDGILREALDASRSLTVELSPPVLHEAGLIGGLNWLASRMAEKNQFKFSLRADNKAEPPTEEMRLLLFECARELLFNAMKHAGVPEAHVTLLRVKDGLIKIVVRDEGKGFDPHLMKKRTADTSTFGLFTVQQRLVHLGGKMEIETAPGKGTTITLTIPVGEAKQPAKKIDEIELEEERVGGVEVREKAAVCRVLIVDDHKIMREGLAGLLQFESDIEVVGEAEDGPQAVALAETLRPDVVIMDVNLPTMNGVEATRRILSRNPAIKVIGLSMHLAHDVAMAMRDAGATAYLTKGGPAEDLIAAIRAAHSA